MRETNGASLSALRRATQAVKPSRAKRRAMAPPVASPAPTTRTTFPTVIQGPELRAYRAVRPRDSACHAAGLPSTRHYGGEWCSKALGPPSVKETRNLLLRPRPCPQPSQRARGRAPDPLVGSRRAASRRWSCVFPPHDLHDRVLREANVTADQPVG